MQVNKYAFIMHIQTRSAHLFCEYLNVEFTAYFKLFSIIEPTFWRRCGQVFITFVKSLANQPVILSSFNIIVGKKSIFELHK